MIVPRPYQTEAIDAARAATLAGHKAILLVMPTGGGKTIVAAIIIDGALKNGSQLLFVAHRRELIAQTYFKLLEMGIPETSLSVIMGNGKLYLRDGRVINAYRPGAQIHICSIDTLRARKDSRPDADIIFTDECHRCMSPSNLALKADYPKAIHIGLTATPFRMGGRGLGQYYDHMIVGTVPSKLMEQGYLVRPTVWTVPASKLPNLDRVKTVAGDYDAKQLADACDRTELVGSIIQHWKKHAGERRTVCFASSIAHSKNIVADFVAAGVPAEHLDGETPADERAAILGRLDSGETLVVSNMSVLCEGWDQPSVKCLILARPTKSTGLYMQCAGRILRPWNGVSAIILDHAGCALAHGLPSEDREFSLSDKKKKRKGESDAPSTKTCQQCFAVVESSCKSCPAVDTDGNVCGYEWPETGGNRFVKTVAGELHAYTEADVATKRAKWEELRVIAKEKHYRFSWIEREFKRIFGHRPPSSFPQNFSGRPMTQGELDVMRSRLMHVASERNIPIAWVKKKMAAVEPPPSESEIVDIPIDDDDIDDSFDFGANVIQ